MIDRLEACKYLVSKLDDDLVVTDIGNQKRDLSDCQ